MIKVSHHHDSQHTKTMKGLIHARKNTPFILLEQRVFHKSPI